MMSLTQRRKRAKESQKKSFQIFAPLRLCVIILLISASASNGEEIYLQDGSRRMAMVEAVDAGGKVTLRLPNGKMQEADLRQIVTITFRGREPRAIRAGAQEFRLVSGDRVMGQIVRLDEDSLIFQNPATGTISSPMSAIHGFLTMPIEGTSGRRAIELVTGDEEEPTGKLDQVLDRRAAGYDGVIEEIDAKELRLDHERLRKTVPLNILYLAGVRLARDTKALKPALPNQPFVRVHTRDGSAMDGLIESVRFGKWRIRPTWQAGKALSVAVEEIVAVEVLNGQAIYLSQLVPSEVNEKTILTPQQRYRMNLNCQGNPLSVRGQLYAWGIGVHADSSLTFGIGGNWSKFESTIGIDDASGDGGSVVFTVSGDGRQLYRSDVLHGSADTPEVISVVVKGIKQLTLKVDATDDLDLGDVANWAGARLVR